MNTNATSCRTEFCGGRPRLPLELPAAITHRRPEWMKGGVVIAGNWSSLMARRQRIGAMWTQTGYGLSDEEAEAGYRRETSPEMADGLRARGVTLVILPLWSGMGSYEDELPGMEDSRHFAELIHARGMRVGVYIHDMNLSLEFLTSRPEAYDWLAWSAPAAPFGPPPPHTESEGHPVYRNHSAYLQFMYGVIRYAVTEVKADFLHFDNFCNTTGFSPTAIEDFRGYLRMKYTDETSRRYFGALDRQDLGVFAHRQETPFWQEWQYFQAWSLGESYRKLADHARSLNAEVATDVNASGLYVGFRRPIDLSILVPHGDAFWDEHAKAGWDPGRRLMQTGIRSYKLARLLHQGAILYTRPGLPMCQAMAFNYDLLGCVAWFLYGRVDGLFGTSPASGMTEEACFYLSHREVFAGGDAVADVAVLRGSAVNLCGPEEAVRNAYLFEQAMIVRHIPFTIIFDQQLRDLSRYRAVVLPDVRMLDDEQIALLLRYVEDGGGLVVADQTAAQDSRGQTRLHPLRQFFRRAAAVSPGEMEEWGRGRILYTQVECPPEFTDGSLPLNDGQLAEAVIRVMGSPSFRADAPPWVAIEYVRFPGRRVMHLLNYAGGDTTAPIRVLLSRNPGDAEKAMLLSPYSPPRVLEIKIKPEGSSIEVPRFHVYAVIVVDGMSAPAAPTPAAPT